MLTFVFRLKLMRVVGYESYGVRELMAPKNKETIRALSAVINFAKYREEKREAYASLADEGSQLSIELKRAEDDNIRAREAFKEIQYGRKPLTDPTSLIVPWLPERRWPQSSLSFRNCNEPKIN